MKTVQFPPSTNQRQDASAVQCESSIVVVGANGAGKTRLGTWIEFSGPDQRRVHRVAAQRALSFPPNISPTNTANAALDFTYGLNAHQSGIPQDQFEQNGVGVRKGYRWNNSPETFLLNDYAALAVLLFSENYDQTLDYVARVRQSPERLDPPITKLDKVKEIWEEVLPHRKLVLKSSGVSAKAPGDAEEYAASLMSDGERVVFYLIGQCVCARPGSVVVIDEPEIHLHKAIQTRLWDAIEVARPDCTFVYLTHDLTFASERTGSTKVCLKGYDGVAFDWYEIPQTEGIPEDILLEVLGSRKPVLFVEGVQGGCQNFRVQGGLRITRMVERIDPGRG
ncbi:AAA family ATPase [Cupriavidus metallidurans]|uniref:AAA family ATPase n=2 Tax=Cupriavidus metallidurans TaxID=119219 RepID=UPI0000550408|nr:AAA family ATPase [Cupriavidus metallidurans]QGS28301.1 AAA family ATPase [Cupriavidus metallidurans]